MNDVEKLFESWRTGEILILLLVIEYSIVIIVYNIHAILTRKKKNRYN
jgi:hypothetical protein